MLDEPDVVDGIPIVQLGMGSRHIGRFDLQIDADAHKLRSFTWKSLRLTPDAAPADEALFANVNELKRVIDDKHKRVVIELARQLTHPVRYRETELGNIICDMVQFVLDVHIALFPSSSLRAEALRPAITLDQLVAAIPYDGPLTIMQVTGEQIQQVVHYMMRDENWGDNPKFFQVNKGFSLEYDRVSHQIVKLKLNGEPLQKDQLYYVTVDEYHYLSSRKVFGLTREQIGESGRAYSVPFSYRKVALRYFSQVNDARMRAQTTGIAPELIYAGLNSVDPSLPLEREVEGRLIIHHPEGYFREEC